MPAGREEEQLYPRIRKSFHMTILSSGTDSTEPSEIVRSSDAYRRLSSVADPRESRPIRAKLNVD